MGWKKVKKLGSLLGDREDIEKRMSLASVQFKSLENLWKSSHSLSLSSKLRAYNALVLSVLLYNAGTWGVNDKVFHELDVFHRGHLRRILCIKWPKTISNKDLYEKCGSERLSEIIRKHRWQLFGHVLRLPKDTPAQMSMFHYCNSFKEKQVEKGRPLTTLPIVLFNEYHSYKQSLRKSGYRQKPITALNELLKIASKRNDWAELVKNVCYIHSNKAGTESEENNELLTSTSRL